MRVRKFPLVISILCLVAGIVAILPVVLPDQLYTMVPWNGELSLLLESVHAHGIPTLFDGQYEPYTISALLFAWALFFILTMRAPAFWWMAPYSLLVIYTLFLFTQLRSGHTEPVFLLSRLSREPTMGSILIILTLLLELTVALLVLIVSLRIHRRYRTRMEDGSQANRKITQRENRKEERRREKELKRELKREQKRVKRAARKQKKSSSDDTEDESALVTVENGEYEDSPQRSSFTSTTVQRDFDTDAPLEFPPMPELPQLKTIARQSHAEGLYVGSVKVRDDESVLLADTPVESIDEPDETPPGRTYDPIPSLRKQMEREAESAPFEVPSSLPKAKERAKPAKESSAVFDAAVETSEHTQGRRDTTRDQKQPAVKEVKESPDQAPIPPEVIQEEDVDLVSGVGGLVSSNAGTSALLTRNRVRYNFPSEDLLDTYPDHVAEVDALTREAGENLIETLKQFKIEATLMNIVKGPTVTMYEVSPAPGVRVSSIISLSDNIALQLAARQVRIVAPIPGKQAVGIEVPNSNRAIIGFKDLLPTIDAKTYQVPMILGRKITGEPVVIEITQTPHLLIAGATGSGKSVCVNSLISSILYRRSPKEVRLILVDPKIVELRVYNGIPHLLTPVISEPKKTIKALEFCLYEMERRYKLLNALAVRNIAAYNKKIKDLKLARERLPYIVVVIDEFADLMTTVGKELETLLARLAAMARAVGIHLVLATQRPSANVITGIIKSNIPTRIAFMVASQIDSRIIIDETGAEKLLGRGDMLFAPGWDPNSVRIQGAFLSDEEVERIVEYAKTQGEPDYLDEGFFEDDDSGNGDDDDDTASDDSSDEALMEKALKIVVERQSASASYLQRRLKIGYNRAARLVEQMEDDGLVGPARGSKPRELLKYPE